MKIWYGCTTAKYLKYREYYDSIRQYIIDQGHVLTRDWLPYFTSSDPANRYKDKEESKREYQQVMKAVREADVQIIEDTVSNFSTGHMISMGILWKIPTLVLWLPDKEKYFNKNFIDGIDSEYLEVSEYNLSNYQDIIRSFIYKYEHATERHHFHLVLDEVERRYLDWAQYFSNRSRTNVIRSALRRMVDDDEEYGKYLKSMK